MSSTTISPNSLSAMEVLEIAMGFQKTQVLYSASSLGIFEELYRSAAPLSAAKIATMLGLHEDGTERLLNACAGLSLLDKTFNSSGTALYENTACSNMFLSKSSPASIKPLVTKVGDLYSIYGHLKDGVREGRCQLGQALGCGDDLFKDGGGFYSDLTKRMEFLQTMHMFSMCDAPLVVKAFDLSQYKTACDLGGGTGAIGHALSVAYPKMHVTVFDLGHVVDVMSHFLPRPKPINIELKAGDFFKDCLPCVDLFVLSHVIHDWDEKHLNQLLGRVYAALNPGGAILVLEKVLNDQKDGPLMTLIFDLGMLVSSNGRERTTDEYRKLLQKQHFADVEVKLLPEARFRDAILARKHR